MGSGKTIVYDGTFNGFLTVIFQVFDNKWSVVDVQKQGVQANGLFTNTVYIKTDIALAKKVWYGINQKNHTAIKRIYYAFLSERKHIELALYHYISYLMGLDESHIDINEIIELLDLQSNKVEKEKRRMEAFAQFQLNKENAGAAHITPKYNVLPLLSKHLRQTNKGKLWKVFDDRRKYGIRHSTLGLELISNSTEVLEAV